MVMKGPAGAPVQAAEALAIQALTFLGEDPERFGRFLATSGISPDSLRASAHEHGFLAGVLDYLLGDEPLLLAFAAAADVAPAHVEKARAALGGPAWEPDGP
jgi:hypothetical protein